MYSAGNSALSSPRAENTSRTHQRATDSVNKYILYLLASFGRHQSGICQEIMGCAVPVWAPHSPSEQLISHFGKLITHQKYHELLLHTHLHTDFNKSTDLLDRCLVVSVALLNMRRLWRTHSLWACQLALALLVLHVCKGSTGFGDLSKEGPVTKPAWCEFGPCSDAPALLSASVSRVQAARVPLPEGQKAHPSHPNDSGFDWEAQNANVHEKWHRRGEGRHPHFKDHRPCTQLATLGTRCLIWTCTGL